MTDAQFRAWLKNKLQAAAARPGYKNGEKPRFTVDQLITDLENILVEAVKKAPQP